MLVQQGVELRVTDDAIRFIAKEGYDPVYGARPVKRAIQRLILNQLSKQLIASKVNHSQPIVVELKDGALEFRN